MGDTRASILRATADVYTRHGYQGATTKRIASSAGVNEVTVFRHFRSKDELIVDALREIRGERIDLVLPALPLNPRRELREWCARVSAELGERKLLLVRSIADAEDRPELSGAFDEQARDLIVAMREYLGKAAATPPVSDKTVTAGAFMLAAAVMLQALATDLEANSTCLDDCVDAVLSAIGYDDGTVLSSRDDDATGAMESADGVP